MPARSSRRPPRWPNRSPPQPFSVMSTHWRPAWPRSPNTLGETVAADRARREEQRAAQTVCKEALAVEAEDPPPTPPSGKLVGDRMRAPSSMSGAPSPGWTRKTDDALWKRYSAARDAFNCRRGSAFRRARSRTPGSEAKERLCGEPGRRWRTPPTGRHRQRVPELAGRMEGGWTGWRHRRHVVAPGGRPGTGSPPAMR